MATKKKKDANPLVVRPTAREIELARITDFVTKSLLRIWFEGKEPKDIVEWTVFANRDATAIVNSLNNAGLLKIETKDAK